MKRLHIVGKSKDNRRLFLAKTKGAKFGSFEIPISRKLLKLIGEAEEARNSHRKPSPKQAEAPAAKTEEEATGSKAVGAPAPGAAEAAPAASASDDPDIDLPVGVRRAPGRPAREPAGRAPAPAPQETAEDRGEAEVGPGRSARELIRDRMQPRRKRPEIPARSNLTPAEIQTLIRAGRSVRTVAERAGTSTAWIRWLAEPVEQERMGIVGQALQQRQVRARLGTSAEPLGEAVVGNLRARGVISPERVVEEGFSALRDGREWKVRLSYAHRGRRLSAAWSFDPVSKEVVPTNALATRLGWREPQAQGEGGAEPPPAPRRRAAAPRRRRRPASRSRGVAKARSASKASRARSASKRRSSSTSAGTRSSTTRKRSGGRRRG